GSRWSSQSPVALRGTVEQALTAVSCTSHSRCTAVGSASFGDGCVVPGGPTPSYPCSIVPLVERFNGIRWSLQRAAKPAGSGRVALRDVSCAESSDCTAVGAAYIKGGYRAFSEHWDGSAWRIQRIIAGSKVQLGSEYQWFRDSPGEVSCSSPHMCQWAV